jgi:hypothetical protein
MAGRKKLAKLRSTMKKVAEAEMGPGAESIEWLCAQIESGKTVGQLADFFAAKMGEGCSRSWFSYVINRDPAHKARIAAARKEAAHAILDEALEIADRQVENESSASVQRARLQADTRVRLAALWNKEVYGTQQAQVQVGIGALYLDALRQCAVIPARTRPTLESGEVDYEVGSDSGVAEPSLLHFAVTRTRGCADGC